LVAEASCCSFNCLVAARSLAVEFFLGAAIAPPLASPAATAAATKILLIMQILLSFSALFEALNRPRRGEFQALG
jgi:hypothetical protein